MRSPYASAFHVDKFEALMIRRHDRRHKIDRDFATTKHQKARLAVAAVTCVRSHRR
jgi:hypothetical protein